METAQKQTGTIQGLSSDCLSGIAFLHIGRARGRLGMIVDAIPCENPTTIRALDAAFGGVIKAGHGAAVDHLLGRKIEYGVDSLGLLTWFNPMDEESPEVT